MHVRQPIGIQNQRARKLQHAGYGRWLRRLGPHLQPLNNVRRQGQRFLFVANSAQRPEMPWPWLLL